MTWTCDISPDTHNAISVLRLLYLRGKKEKWSEFLFTGEDKERDHAVYTGKVEL